MAQELPQSIPFSSLYDLQQKFLFYLGHLHREATPQLAAYLQQRGGSTWLIDGNLDNQLYVELVLGELSALPRKLAEAGRTTGPWNNARPRSRQWKCSAFRSRSSTRRATSPM